MDKLRITGGRPLEGEVAVSGAKNAALPIMCAALLTPKPLTLGNIPRLMDISTMAKLMAQMGVEVERSANGLVLDSKGLSNPVAGYDLVKTMRASVLVLGPLVARCGRAKVSLPGGCAIGLRPVDQHVKGLQAMGADISIEHGYMLRDLNNDGKPDLYVCNDLFTPDRIWINQGAGRFKALPGLAVRHTSLASMGSATARGSRAREATSSASRACLRSPAPRTASCPTASRPAPTSRPPRPPAGAFA